MKQVELYNHNKTTYENITRIFETSNKCATVQPTGSGKSFLIFKLAQDNSDKTIIVFEPNRQIISRVSEQMKEYGIDNIKLYTYQKLNSQHKRDEISIANADYICLDELHRIKAKQWEQAVIAIQEKFPNAKVLGLTATPERMDGQNIIDYFGAELACNITLGDAIVNKILPCPTYISALYTFDEEIQKVSEKIDESKNSDEEKNEMRAELNEARKQLENAPGVPAILKKHILNNDGKYLVFCQNAEHLNTMKSVIGEWFAQAGFDVNMYEVHTQNPNHKTEYNQFQTDNSEHIKLCLCIDMFNEGVHLEGISGVILLRPTQSNIIYFQQIGRAISASDNNIPIIFDLVNNSNSLGGGNLRTEIKSAVERQREEIAECSSECDKEIFDIGNFRIYDYVKDSLNVFSDIENKCIDDFDFRLKQLEEYKAKWGHCCVMKEEAKEWSGLYEWTMYYKENNRNKIDTYKVNLLNKIGYIWDLNDWKFKKAICHINQYIEEGNKLPIPAHYICSDGFKLGQWITSCVRAKKNKHLNPKYENVLNHLGISLSKTSLGNRWMNMYNSCVEYIRNTGNTINRNTVYQDKRIGIWLSNNKQKHKLGLLSKEQSDLLTSIFDNDNWKQFIVLLKECLDNNVCIKCQTVYKNKKIGQKITTCKQFYKNGKFPEERYQQLLELGIDLAKKGSLM